MYVCIYINIYVYIHLNIHLLQVWSILVVEIQHDPLDAIYYQHFKGVWYFSSEDLLGLFVFQLSVTSISFSFSSYHDHSGSSALPQGLGVSCALAGKIRTAGRWMFLLKGPGIQI